MLRRLFSLVSACAVLFFCSVPAFATAVEPGGTGGIGIPIVGNIDVDVVELFEFMSANGEENGRWIVNTVGHLIDEDICPNAPHVGGGHNFVPRRTLKNGQVGRYNVCEYCGKAYGEACQEAYEQYVDTLPGTRYNSDGAFLWSPSFSDVVSGSGSVQSSVRFYYSSGSYTTYVYLDGNRVTYNGVTAYIVPENRSFVLLQGNNHYSVGIYSDVNFKAPWDAFYVSTGDSAWSRHHNGAFSAGAIFNFGDSRRSTDSLYVVELPSFYVTPFSLPSFSTDTRVSAANNDSTGLYGYMDNGTLVQSAADTIFTESGDVYTNPVTNETKNITSWDYDYTDRSYTLTTNEGDTVTVTYGDTNVTINEGAETYNVYYLVEHDDSVPCDHTYSSQITQSPTCTTGGVKTYTCSICGDTYTQELPATGHSYFSSVTQEATCTATGVRTFVCSVCGDTYTETIAATGHSYSSEVTTAATCTATGVRTSTCSVCGDVQTQTIPATGHNYVAEVTMEPTCTATGVRTFTCSVCGDSYTRSIPATGHRWRVLRTVANQYDSGGELTQAGYTLYECETCGEQYRIDAASSGTELPNASSEGASTGTGSGGDDSGNGDSDVGSGFLLKIARGLTKDLPEVLKMVSEWFTKIPDLFDGYSKFLAASFSWLPEECAMLIAFGVHMVVLLGILKACFRR